MRRPTHTCPCRTSGRHHHHHHRFDSGGIVAALLYLCMSLLGLTFTPSPLAAFGVIGYSFALYGLNILVGRVENPRAGVFLNPTYYMALTAPI